MKEQLLKAKEYIISLTDQEGNMWCITVYGMLEITGTISPRDLIEASLLFDELSNVKVKRPHSQVDLPIGSDSCSILPNKVAEIDNIQLL